jgi:hypothetical protein
MPTHTHPHRMTRLSLSPPFSLNSAAPLDRPPSLRSPPSIVHPSIQLNTGEKYHSSHFTLASNQVDSYPLHRIEATINLPPSMSEQRARAF